MVKGNALNGNAIKNNQPILIEQFSVDLTFYFLKNGDIQIGLVQQYCRIVHLSY